ncbi:MAG: polyphosphate kinase 2 family protein [Puniceicoccaceae bacterium]|nr:MAG: polyphosphate kinase 2 family protein [Puniceicoccaceae bacterium]
MNLACKTDDFRVPTTGNARTRLRIDDLPTQVPAFYDSKKHYRELLEEFTGELAELQRVLYAHGRYALLVIFQAMDAAGKDGAIRHVMSGVNPQGCQVFSFKAPSSEELDHDFLWRTSKRLPERGRIGIFNRSYYEEVLIVKVNPAILERQRLPRECLKRRHFWKERYQDIVSFEDYLHRNGTRVVKFFLHLSKEEQRKRFLSRIDEPDKNWKLTVDDIRVRDKWDEYMQAYQDCLRHTSHKAAPWYSIPADDKRNARLIISHVLVETLKSLEISYPTVTDEQRRQLHEIRDRLTEKADR